MQKNKGDTAIIIIHKLHTYQLSGHYLQKWDLDSMIICLHDLPKTLPEEEEEGFRMTPNTIDQTLNLRN